MKMTTLFAATLCFTLALSANAWVDFVDCSADQQPIVQSAIDSSHAWIDNALANIALPQPNGTYAKWFGSYTDSNLSTVKTNLQTIRSHLLIGVISAHCQCPASADTDHDYALVDSPNHGIKKTPYNVYFCNKFFAGATPDIGFDSRPGIVIHEMSHFDNVADTIDECSSFTNRQSLAALPDHAIVSAGNYEYYVEEVQP
ncbi:M35 family metallo-endopeptidase [Mesorhizobium sp. M0954]|uniref:M35 family metallo-endopeptidase n=1 Tax=Mesorhizobium sp. M0954 TaxID=2957032 RepID=UPI00333B0749